MTEYRTTKRWMRAACALALACGMSGGAVAAGREPSLIGEIRLPTGLAIDGVAFGGISDLDYDPRSGLFYAISDDRAENGPARFYKLKLTYSQRGGAGVDIVETVPLRGEGGALFAPKDIDPEGISLDPRGGLLVWASEGDRQGRPAIYEASIDGYRRRTFDIPAYYLPDGERKTGVRDNLSFEGLSHSPDGATLFSALENALTQDGDKATLQAGSPSRILALDPRTAKPVAEYVYVTEPIPRAATGLPPYADNGVSAVLALDGERLLVVERSFAVGYGNTIRVFETSLKGATDVLGRTSLRDTVYTPAAKTLLFTLEEGTFGLDMDNIESISFGPEIDGRKTLVLASDNNFNPRGQVTQFIMLAFDPDAPAP
ncbi:esterase-like activity of phytase family protein [Pseudochelatococcus lubricantis]|uniref:esterase-like activity of phytase family protein n=1 Tax=Pseudochelatococcus lubricantis TaxID=1538102 RepID=UPI0035EC95F4